MRKNLMGALIDFALAGVNVAIAVWSGHWISWGIAVLCFGLGLVELHFEG